MVVETARRQCSIGERQCVRTGDADERELLNRDGAARIGGRSPRIGGGRQRCGDVEVLLVMVLPTRVLMSTTGCCREYGTRRGRCGRLCGVPNLAAAPAPTRLSDRRAEASVPSHEMMLYEPREH